MSEYLYDRIFAPTEAVKAVAEQDGTPFYLYHKQGILDSVHSLNLAFAWADEYRNYFNLRENNNPEILKLLAQAGSGVSVCSYTELRLAEKCGFSGERILYEPTRREDAAEKLARKLNAVWMINGVDLIPTDLPQRMILRYHPSEERLTAVQFTTVGKSKNGICSPEILAVLDDLHRRGVEKLGIALQVASYCIKPGFWEKKANVLLSLAAEVKEKSGFALWCIHIGEGPGLAYQARVTAPSVEEEADRVRALYAGLSVADRPAVFTGVNRRLLEQNGVLVTKVLEQRDLYHTYLILDAGIGHYLRPVLKSAYRHISVLGKHQTEDRKRYYLAGMLPDEIDHLSQKPRMLPKVEPGDYCVVHDVGCGARSMPMLYGCPSIAAEYLFDEDGTIRPISPHRSEQEVLDFLTAW